MKSEGSIVGTLVFILIGPLVWALHLLVAYGSHASLCAVAGAGRLADPLPWILGGVTLAAALILALALASPSTFRRPLRAARRDDREAAFATGVMRVLALLSLLGVLFAGIAMVILPLCQQLR